MSQWRTTDSQPKGDKPPTCRDYSLPELTLETTFCLWNCDREFWKVREFSRSDCGWADALTSRIYLNPDLSCDFEHTSAHEIGHVLNLRNVYDMECKEKTVMYGYSTGNPPVQIVDCEAAEEAILRSGPLLMARARGRPSIRRAEARLRGPARRPKTTATKWRLVPLAGRRYFAGRCRST